MVLRWLFDSKSANTQKMRDVPKTDVSHSELAKFKRQETMPSVFWPSKSFPLDAVGESNYQEALVAIAGRHKRDTQIVPVGAVIRREPNNPFDGNAVRVEIEGKLVGYIPREQANRVAYQMDSHSTSEATCDAQIRGGWRTNQFDEGMYGVKLGVPRRGQIEFSKP